MPFEKQNACDAHRARFEVSGSGLRQGVGLTASLARMSLTKGSRMMKFDATD